MDGRPLVKGIGLLVLSVLALVACAPGSSSSNTTTGGSVNVLGTWGGDEQASFLAMVKPFTDQTGIKVNYEGTRDINAVLTTRVQAGNPPELAGLPGPGQMFQFAKDNKLVALDNVLDMGAMNSQYSSNWVKLGQYNGKTYSIFIKTSLKGLVWYDPKNFAAKSYQVPTSWDQLQSLQGQIASSGAKPWCIGLSSGSASGWPGSDWVKEIVLSQSGPTVYNAWWSGKQKWSTPEIKKAWQTWGQMILGANGTNVYGGPQYMAATAFGDAGQPLFTSPPGCYMHNQGSFMNSFFDAYSTKPQTGVDYKFFALPDINSQYTGARVVAGDLFGMFKDTPQARALIKYLTTPAAQDIWVKRGGAISPNKNVSFSDYPDDLSRSIAQSMINTKLPEFDAGDLMPSAMQTAYWKAVLDFVGDQSKLDSILATLDKVQADSY